MKQLEQICIQLDAPIVPDQGLGGVLLRTRVREIQDILVFPGKNAKFRLVSLFEARYSLADGAIEIAVDVRNSKIFKLMARSGYQGLLFDKIRVGLTVREAMALVPALYYDETEEMILCKGYPGVSLDVLEVDPSPERVPDMTIDSINVFASEIAALDGQEGAW
jgi:hypothetical protein